METDKLKLKDLVTIGIFVLIYFIASFAIGTPFGFTVIGFLFYPMVMAILTGVVTMFFMAKTPKKWAVFLFFFLPGLIMTLMGHTVIVAIHSLIIALIAEFVHRSKGLKSIKGNILTHAIGSMYAIGSFWQIYIMSDKYYAMTVELMGKEYADKLINLPLWVMLLLYISVFIGGLIGGKIGQKLLKKHFEKAGLVS
ncbi:MAG: MptD family putative ECF transporter S component [Tissierellia bacterium]|nr:MptD family putative ECF transporter S component [Tissierellia bacterium]